MPYHIRAVQATFFPKSHIEAPSTLCALAGVTPAKVEHLLMAVSKTGGVALSLGPTNGIRALCCIGIVVAHCLYWASLAHEDKAALYKGYAGNTWMNFVLHNAEPSMDAFLVLTG